MDPLHYYIWMCIVLSYVAVSVTCSGRVLHVLRDRVGVSLVAVSVTLFIVSRFSPSQWDIEDTPTELLKTRPSGHMTR